MDLEHRISQRMSAIGNAVAAAAGVPRMDAVEIAVAEDAATYGDRYLRLQAVAMVQEWMATEAADLEEGETLADRLLMLAIGMADENIDGELTDDEQEEVDELLENAWDYLAGKGATEEDIDALLNESSAEAAERVVELLRNTIADGDGAAEDMERFAFAPNVSMDAVYKRRLAIRNGRKVRINKRVSGRVRLTGRQKMAIRKASRRSHNSRANMRRAKSKRIRSRLIR